MGNLLAGKICVLQGSDWRPMLFTAQQANVPKSESLTGVNSTWLESLVLTTRVAGSGSTFPDLLKVQLNLTSVGGSASTSHRMITVSRRSAPMVRDLYFSLHRGGSVNK